MAEDEEHPLALSLPAKRKGSPGTTAASAPSVRRPAPRMQREHARRQKMSSLYAELRTLLPGLPACVRPTSTQILEDAIAYVGALRGTAAELEAYRAVAARRSRVAAMSGDGGGGGGAGDPAAEVVLASGEASCFAVRLPAARRLGSLTRVLEVFHRHGVAVLAATVATNGGEAAVTVTTSAVAAGVVERIKAEIVGSVARSVN